MTYRIDVVYQGTARQAAEKVRFERFVRGHDFSRADKPFIFLPEPALAGGTGPGFDFFRSLESRALSKHEDQLLSQSRALIRTGTIREMSPVYM